MRHDPAVASRVDGSSGGSTSNGPTDLSQPATTPAAHKISERARRLKMMRIEKARRERRRLTDVATAQYVRGSETYRKIFRQCVHRSTIQSHEIHSVRDEWHVLPTDVTTAEGALPHQGKRNLPASSAHACRERVLENIRHSDFIGEV